MDEESARGDLMGDLMASCLRLDECIIVRGSIGSSFDSWLTMLLLVSAM